MLNRRELLAAVAALAGTGFSPVAIPQSYPIKPIRIVVPFPPGGATDIMARTMAQKLGEVWQQPVIVENKAGGNALIGADAVAKSQPDGYVVLVATIAHSANVTLFPSAPYQLQRDLQPVAIMGLIPLVSVVRADSPVRSLQELVTLSKSKNVNAGSSGNGAASHLGLELFKGVTGAKIQHVPYKGGAPAITDLLGGQIDVIFALLPECLPHIKSGKLRALAIMADKRYELLPDTPTTSEAGIPGIEVTSWNGLMVPAGTSSDVVSKINAEVTKIASAAEIRARIIDLGFLPVAMGVSDTEKFVKADVQRWAKVISEANIKVD